MKDTFGMSLVVLDANGNTREMRLHALDDGTARVAMSDTEENSYSYEMTVDPYALLRACGVLVDETNRRKRRALPCVCGARKEG